MFTYQNVNALSSTHAMKINALSNSRKQIFLYIMMAAIATSLGILLSCGTEISVLLNFQYIIFLFVISMTIFPYIYIFVKKQLNVPIKENVKEWLSIIDGIVFAFVLFLVYDGFSFGAVFVAFRLITSISCKHISSLSDEDFLKVRNELIWPSILIIATCFFTGYASYTLSLDGFLLPTNSLPLFLPFIYLATYCFAICYMKDKQVTDDGKTRVSWIHIAFVIFLIVFAFLGKHVELLSFFPTLLLGVVFAFHLAIFNAFLLTKRHSGKQDELNKYVASTSMANNIILLVSPLCFAFSDLNGIYILSFLLIFCISTVYWVGRKGRIKEIRNSRAFLCILSSIFLAISILTPLFGFEQIVGISETLANLTRFIMGKIHSIVITGGILAGVLTYVVAIVRKNILFFLINPVSYHDQSNLLKQISIISCVLILLMMLALGIWDFLDAGSINFCLSILSYIIIVLVSLSSMSVNLFRTALTNDGGIK